MKYTAFLKLHTPTLNHLQSSRQSLWHAISVENASVRLEEGSLKPFTSHRYWGDGIRRKEDDPLYDDSYWMYGWSMTRKREYAFQWNSVVLEFDAEKIANQFKIIPIAWNNLFKHNKTFQKKEFEEFILSKKIGKSILELKKEDEENDILLDKLYDLPETEETEKKIKEISSIPSWFHRWKSSYGKELNLSKCLKAIYINEEVLKLYSQSKQDVEILQNIINHPLYKGTFQDPHTNNRKKLKKNI